MRLPIIASFLACSLLGGAGSLQARDTPAPAPAAQATDPRNLAGMTSDLAVAVFLQLCIGNPTDHDARQAWLRSHGFAMLPPPAAAGHLNAGPGTAWMRPDPTSVGFPIVAVSRPAGLQCEIRASMADPARAAARFDQAIQGLATPGLVIRKDTDRDSAPNGGPGRFLSYRVGAAPIERGGFIFAMSARPPVPGGLALLMTASPAPRQ